MIEREPENAEAHALRGGVLGLRINGFMQGMLLGPKAKKSTQRGFELDSSNPRAALHRGIGFFFTPKKFGGGLERAESELRRNLGWILLDMNMLSRRELTRLIALKAEETMWAA